MPTYEYRCTACDHQFEIFQQMSDAVKRKCPECGKNKLERLIGTGAGIIFKGGGFYQTDYRSDSYKKAAEAETKAAEPAKAESKPETKSETKAVETAATPKPESKATKKKAKSKE
jgi:putative FmdB family regulatory protein